MHFVWGGVLYMALVWRKKQRGGVMEKEKWETKHDGRKKRMGGRQKKRASVCGGSTRKESTVKQMAGE